MSNSRNRKIEDAFLFRQRMILIYWLLTPILVFDVLCVSAQDLPSDLSGFDTDEIFNISDGRPLEPGDETLARLLYRVSRTSINSFRDFSRFTTGISLADLFAHPRDFRCYVVPVTGRVKSVYSIDIPHQDSDTSVSKFQLVRFQDGENNECLVAVPAEQVEQRATGVPERWPVNQLLDEPASFFGFFMAIHDFHSDDTQPNSISAANLPGLHNTECAVFVSKQISWFPASTNEQFTVTQSEILLSRHGVDIAGLDNVRNNIRGKIRREQTDSFYQMLSASQRIKPSEFPTNIVDFKVCLTDPELNQVSALNLQGKVRRVTKIPIDNDEIGKRFGIDHYFQLDLFVPLDNHEIVVRSPDSRVNDGDKPPAKIVHENRYPVFVCVVEIPCSESELVGKQIQVSGFFFKLWDYESELSQTDRSLPRQVSPLVIGLSPKVVVPAANPLNFWIASGCFVFIAGSGLLFWIYGPGDTTKFRRHHRGDLESSDKIEFPEG